MSTSTAVTITATYQGDSVHSGGFGTASVVVTPRSVSVNVSCSPNNIAPTTSTKCTVTIQDNAGGTKVTPTGTVSFSDTIGGAFLPAQCTLSSGTCSANYTAPVVKASTPVTITATYTGDAIHGDGAHSTNIQVTPRPVSVSVNCSPSTISPLTSTTCTVTVKDTGPGTAIVPTGTVTFTSDRGGTFSTPQCALSNGSCSVTYTAPLVSTSTNVTITATYAGDEVHSGGSNHVQVNVI